MSMNDNEKFIAYEFFRRERDGENRYIATLPERRKDPERITHASIMNWAKTLVPKDVFDDRVYFVRVKI